jgi:hypothetical protein
LVGVAPNLPSRLFEETDERMSDVTIRRIWAAHLDELFALHRQVVEGLPAEELYVGHDADWLSRHICEEGLCLGAFKDQRLIGYAILRFPNASPDNLGKLMGLKPSELTNVAQLQGSGISFRYRGRGLQSEFTRRRLSLAKELGYRHACVSVSPLNVISLRNMLEHDLRIIAVIDRLAGYRRLVLYKDVLHGTALRSTISMRLVRLEDTAAVRAAIDEGYVGSLLAPSGSNYQLLMVRDGRSVSRYASVNDQASV